MYDDDINVQSVKPASTTSETVDPGQMDANKSGNTNTNYNYSNNNNNAANSNTVNNFGRAAYPQNPRPAFSNPNANSFTGQSGYNYRGNSSNYSYGQNRYVSGQGMQQPSYGTYQYGNSDNFGAPVQPAAPVKKKGKALKVLLVAVLVLALLSGGGYYAYTNFARSPQLAQNQQQEQGEDQQNQVVDNTVEEQDTPIQTTTTSGESLAVVTDVTAVVAEVMPAMVMIRNNFTASANYFGYSTSEEATASGSGFIVGENDTELLVATNYHVIEGADSLEVIFADDAVVEAVVKGTDSEMDLAVIAVMLDDISSETKAAIKVATLGSSETLTLGEPAIAIGNALGYGQSVTTGVISAINREVEISEGVKQTFIQTDAAINPGNSGGALLNMNGEVVGINSNKIGGEAIEGMGYAIPISVAQPIIDKLMNEETRLKVASADRGYIGISGVGVTSDVTAGYGIPQGVYVADVSRGGGADEAGIQKGDVITEFEGWEITSMDDLQTRLQYYAAGTDVTIKVLRQARNGEEYEEMTFTVTLGAAAGSGSSSDTTAGTDGSGYDGNALPGGKEGDDDSNDGGH
jgi:serine protease Do